MGDADDTYPLNELGTFVEDLEAGTDLVIGSRFKGTIHGDAMPFLNRFVGNPVLTGMLNVMFGVRVSDAHCGMRALRRDALAVLDLHSTGMEFASEMVFKAYRRGLTVSEVPIDYYPRVGESKLNRFGDAWRHVRFMLLYSPSWLYLGPGGVLLAARSGRDGRARVRPDRHPRPDVADPHDARIRRDDAHRSTGRPARGLRSDVRARADRRARRAAREARQAHHARARPRRGRPPHPVRGLSALPGWRSSGRRTGFGALGRAYETALLVTALGLGIQIVFSAFFLALLTMPLRRETTAVSE